MTTMLNSKPPQNTYAVSDQVQTGFYSCSQEKEKFQICFENLLPTG